MNTSTTREPKNIGNIMGKKSRFYDSNARARHYLLTVEGCSDVWFKRHTRRKDKVFTPTHYYLATDLFLLFDGAALSPRGLILFQVKSGNWPKTEPLNEFKRKYGNIIMAMNVRKKDNRIQVFVREYPYEGRDING